MKKALIVNYFGDNLKIPGGRRVATWIDILDALGFEVECSFAPKSNNPNIFVKLFLRFISLFKKYPYKNFKWLDEQKEKINSIDYQVIVYMIPEYELMELIEEREGVFQIVDIRDGILYESLFTKIETFFFQKVLTKFEDNIKRADLVTTNIPGLKRYYSDKYSIDVRLLINQLDRKSIIRTTEGRAPRVLYSGGLMRSSRGQNAFNILEAFRQYRKAVGDISITFIGRFNVIEKILYKLAFREVEFKEEVSADALNQIVSDFNLLLVVNTTDRDLLPSKYLFYRQTDAPILSVGTSYSLNQIVSNDEGVISVENSSQEVLNALKALDLSQKYKRDSLIKDDKSQIMEELNKACLF